MAGKSPQDSVDPRRSLPSVTQLAKELAASVPEVPGWAATEAARRVLGQAREALDRQLEDKPAATATGSGDCLASAIQTARRLARTHPRRVINATGVVLHTNLGRAPLPAGAADAVRAVVAGYSDLELDLETGRRGSRLGALEEKLRELSGAEAAYACNNNAAAVMLGLDTLARGREVIVSRGELVEIGGSFRVPDIMERAGVRLVEVGTTNRTHPRDYARAIGPETALLLKVHRSNFSQTGFVTEVSLEEIVAIGRDNQLPVMEDLGSGTLVDLTPHGFPADSFVPSRLRTGADLVCFSGDKLLGGPQAGILLGSAAVMAEVRQNPLARALRLDKMSLAALDWTLDAYLEGRAETEVPVLRQLLEPSDSLEARAQHLADTLRAACSHKGVDVTVEADRAPVGGGSLPGFELATWVVALRAAATEEPSFRATRTAERLRAATPPILTRVRDDAILFDVRTLDADDLVSVRDAVSQVFL
jgi:L-seryl-tRNA(Ser) seleniumtransferase